MKRDKTKLQPELKDAGRRARPTISPEELAEVLRRLDPDVMDDQRKTARPGRREVMRELLQKHRGPR